MKKAFTLLELIIVVGILSLLIGGISFFVPNTKDKKIKFGKECSNYIFQEIINEQHNINKSKVIRSGEIILTPIKAEISGDGGISIKRYYTNDIAFTNKIVDSSGACMNDKISNENLFTINTDLKEIFFQKDLVRSSNEIKIKSCIQDQEDCVEVSKINYNQANKKFEQSFCLSLSGNNCSKWEE